MAPAAVIYLQEVMKYQNTGVKSYDDASTVPRAPGRRCRKYKTPKLLGRV